MKYLCHRNEIPENGSKGFDIDGNSIFVVHYLQQFFGYRNRCPHLGLELNWQPDQFLTIDNTLIQCATHGALFLIDSGECVSGPCNGQALQPITIQLIDEQLNWVP
jgi:nitrite reductase/ring-hydroxylating ferredoxin subunit